MECKVLHDIPGRLRVHLNSKPMTLQEADVIEYYLRNSKIIKDVKEIGRAHV